MLAPICYRCMRPIQFCTCRNLAAVRYDRCGSCGPTLTTAGTCPVCDRLVVALAEADAEMGRRR